VVQVGQTKPTRVRNEDLPVLPLAKKSGAKMRQADPSRGRLFTDFVLVTPVGWAGEMHLPGTGGGGEQAGLVLLPAL